MDRKHRARHRLADSERTLGILVWQPIGFCRRTGWVNGGWEYDLSLCPATRYHYDDDDNLVGTTNYLGHLRETAGTLGR